MSTRSRWLDWKPETQKFRETPRYEPTKPSKPGFVGFDGSPLADSQNLGAEICPPGEGKSATSMECKAGEAAEVLPCPSPEELAQASAVLAQAGIRLMRINGVDYIGVWSDLDGPRVRAALAVFHPDGIPPVLYLDGDVPMRFKLRKVPGEPVPAHVLAAMEEEPNQPWVIRDRMLKEMNWSPDGIPWAEWKARSLNKLFNEQGVTGRPGRITPATVQHGESGGTK
jgi:hypothetical protein